MEWGETDRMPDAEQARMAMSPHPYKIRAVINAAIVQPGKAYAQPNGQARASCHLSKRSAHLLVIECNIFL
jgi:hypothetical protein